MLIALVALALAAGSSFKDCPTCPEMVVAPAGSFIMGSSDREPGRAADEGPQHTEVIGRPFAVARFEVTREDYARFVRETGRPVGGNCITDRLKRGHWAAEPGTTFLDPGYAQTDRHPVACVSWEDATAYVAWLNGKTRGGYRLLTEAEWEYAARAGSTTAYPWGDSKDGGCADSNVLDQRFRTKYPEPQTVPDGQSAACDDGALNTAPVGSYRANAFGLHDMTGNLNEWTADCASPDYATTTRDCAKRMVRGGSWGTYMRQQRSAERLRYAPTDRDDAIGIRVGKTLD